MEERCTEADIVGHLCLSEPKFEPINVLTVETRSHALNFERLSG
jgi:hypothetical protein